MQLPLLFAAAIGLGLASAHAWNNREDFRALLPNSSVKIEGYSPCGAACAHSCAQAAAAMLVDDAESVSALAPENAQPETL